MSTDLVLFFNKAPTHVRELRVDEATWPPFYLIDTTGQANSRGAIQCCRISEYPPNSSLVSFPPHLFRLIGPIRYAYYKPRHPAQIGRSHGNYLTVLPSLRHGEYA